MRLIKTFPTVGPDKTVTCQVEIITDQTAWNTVNVYATILDNRGPMYSKPHTFKESHLTPDDIIRIEEELQTLAVRFVNEGYIPSLQQRLKTMDYKEQEAPLGYKAWVNPSVHIDPPKQALI